MIYGSPPIASESLSTGDTGKGERDHLEVTVIEMWERIEDSIDLLHQGVCKDMP